MDHAGHDDAHALASSLGPALRQACDGRLGEINWFRAAWQHGGAATGFALFTLPDGRTIETLVKLPVGAIEFRWTCGLGTLDADDATRAELLATPRVLASGPEVGGHDLAWLVVEKLHGHPLSQGMNADDVLGLLQAACDFHETAGRVRPQIDPPKVMDWESSIERSRAKARDGAISEGQKWNEAIKHVQRVLPRLLAKWNHRACGWWCHGDLHPGNAMRRVRPGGDDSPAGGRVVLIDLALVHSGHWVEDAVYLERQYWGRAELLHGVKPVSTLARLRRERGLPVEDHYMDIANIRRVLMASLVPLFMEREGNTKYMHAALETINNLLPMVSK